MNHIKCLQVASITRSIDETKFAEMYLMNNDLVIRINDITDNKYSVIATFPKDKFRDANHYFNSLTER